jgi:glycosyltransferase involved in cell wall biosynthesis
MVKEEIIKEKVKVSIICNAYNHENYIRDALDGFLMQKTDFPFEILIHDDASTDTTADIIREYEAKYPDIFIPIYQTENQYSKGGGITDKFQFPRVNGDFVAICEGDDYWIDENKLQKQYDAMMAHPECDICTCTAEVRWAKNGEFSRYSGPELDDGVIPIEKVIKGGGGFVSTATLFIRTSSLKDLPPFRKVLSSDYMWQIHGSLRGGMLFLKDAMAVYRFGGDSSYNARIKKDKSILARFHRKTIDALKQLDIDTNGKYHDVIEDTLITQEMIVYNAERKFKKLLKWKYLKRYKKKSKALRVIILAFFPFVSKIWEKIGGSK